MDIVDQAADIEQHSRNVALSYRAPTLAFIGRCHYCKSEIDLRARFCDAECCKDYNELERSHARRSGQRG
jgi:hypothetical protein